ncbi:hypothetical protein AB0P17_39300 [Streptomyces sp. NPDC088124]|uniref:hypothetical protein n=1 Tax=Streptomyces sp. NPDC088124 TaxID=3154654 RepID=UPI0034460F87
MEQRLTTGTRTDERAGSGTAGERKEREQRRRPGQRIELSLPQVAGSALAAVAAAVLASQLGVYGTIIGAGVVSVVATCGGSVFQHFFHRTGEQIRVAAVQARPGGRQVAVPPDRGDPVRGSDVLGPAPPVNEEFNRATTHGTRVRGWKRPVLAAGVVFGVAMAGVTGFELISGQGLGGGTGTTVGSVVSGGGHRSAPTPATDPASTPSGDTGNGTGADGDQGGTPGSGTSPAPSGGAARDGTTKDSGTGTGTGTGNGTGNGTDPIGTPSSPSPVDSSGPARDSGGDSGTSSTPAPAPSGTADTGSGTGGDSGPTGG